MSKRLKEIAELGPSEQQLCLVPTATGKRFIRRFIFNSTIAAFIISPTFTFYCYNMASKGTQNYPATPPKYLNDFSKALASEVRILLAEVGKLRDERRQLQYEIAELMSVKSKFGAGGEYSPDWAPPKGPEPPAIEAPLPAIEEAPAPARPGWRVVQKRPERKPRTKAAPAAAASPPPALPEPPRVPEMPAWAQWRPNPLLAPTPIAAPAAMPPPTSPPPRSGLFGPSTPPPK
ncbi:hypothetical protein BDQ12DRAFT_154318 [Crucibulum laeve]|uniref:Uncharacterized protein n=1 Tax=Crucibulum laeve TaxID=68775 RepID=A0A5C3LE22_9AGAR|nr:hypothetical protein BDQ12DRAFT_154318 [Crucibulum laeve]